MNRGRGLSSGLPPDHPGGAMRYVAPISLVDTVAALRSGQLDPHDHVDALLDRIEALDPVLLALLPEPGRRQRLHADAADLLMRHPHPDDRPPLFGALVGVKDVLRVDGLPTAAGSTLPARRLAGAESAAVRSLRAAGALPLGKTRTAEFAYAAPGPTRNPYDPGHTPGGSSHGSAAGVAAGFFPLALGTQTIGSIIRPAAFCGVAGFVPTYGRIPADGTLHVSRSLDRVGPFAGDAAGILLAAAALISRWHPVGGAPRPVLGVADGPFLEAAEPAARELFERQVDILAAAGYQVRRELVFEDAAEVAQSLRRLMNGEFAREHAALFERYQDRYRPQTAGGIEQGISASGSPWPNLPWSYVRLPAVAIPAGAIGELPVGLQLVGGWHADEELLEWAVALGRDLGFPTLPAPAHQPRPQSFTWW